ncbi:MAG: FHA domain-containing protein [bacterium]
MLRLVIEDGEGTTHVVPLIRDEITIGRQEGNTIRLTERNVSRRHARLVRAGTDSSPTVLVEDLDSYNGVRLNGDKVAGKCTMRPADLLQIGDYSLALKTEDAEGDLGSLAGQIKAPEEPPPPAIDPKLPDEERGRFVVVSSNLAGSEFNLDRRELIIGRTESDENDVVIAHRSISRHHAKVIHRDGTFTIIDLASSNGVKVNGEAFGTATLVNGDIIELGHVKLRFCAPGDDYVFTSADVDDVEVEGGPSVWQMVFVALLLVGVAIVAFLIVDRMNHDRDTVPPVAGAAGTAGAAATPRPPEPIAPPPVDVGPDLAEAERLAAAENWDGAIAAYDRVLIAKPADDTARAGRDRAIREKGHRGQLERLAAAVDDKNWAVALDRLGDVPEDSVYAARVAELRPRIETGYADAEYKRGRALVDERRLDDADALAAALAARPYTQDAARKLRDDITSARAAAAATPPVERPTPVAVVQDPPTPPTQNPPTQTPPTPKRPERPPPAARDDYTSFIERGLQAMGRGDRAAATVLFEKAREARPGSKVPYQRLCAVYKAQENYARALPNCERWLSMEENASYKVQIQRTIDQIKDRLGQ